MVSGAQFQKDNVFLLKFNMYRWGRREPVAVRGRCAKLMTICEERPANGGDHEAMSETPHFCGPEHMGIGWSSGVKRKEGEVMWQNGEKEANKTRRAEVWLGGELVWRGDEPRARQGYDDDALEHKKEKTMLVLENEVWEGPRNPKREERN